MDDLKKDILKNSGLNEEVLEEGIVFFKNSKKIKRLSKALVKKADKLSSKGKVEPANELFRFAKEANKIANKFKELEDEFSIFGSKTEKDRIKDDYEMVTNEFSGLLKIARNDSFKKAAAVAKGLVIVSSILFAGGALLASMESSAGVLTGAGENLAARAGNAVTTTSSTDTALDTVRRAGEQVGRNMVIKQTNQDLLKASLATGATIGSAIGANALNDLKKAGVKNKTITDTVRVIEDLKSSENQRYKGLNNE